MWVSSTIFQRTTAVFLISTLVLATSPTAVSAHALASPSQEQSTGQSPEQLAQLVAPIALYPDALVAQILAGATYPTQIVEADRWVKQNSKLQGEDLAKAVDKQAWDESVKALTQFPSVLDNMSKNLSWTSALGDAYFNEPQNVMAEVQRLRRQAKDAGNLKSTPQQTVTTQGQTIIIQPANPEIVYVPTYNPTVIYGTPVAVYPGYSGWDVAAASMISFGVGMAVGAAVRGGGCCGWGWNSWGCNWHGGSVLYNRNVYVSRSNVFVNRNSYYRNPNGYRGAAGTVAGGRYGNTNINRSGNNINRSGNLSGNTINRGGGNTVNRGGNTINVNGNPNRPATPAAARDIGQPKQGQAGASANPARGYGQVNREKGTNSNAFSGYTAGGNAMTQQSRGRSSFSGGGGSRAPMRSGGGGRRR
jgi:hypothetical protein